MDPRDTAYALCEAGNFSEALEHFKLLESNATDPSERAGYLADMATCHHELGSLTEAEDCIARAKLLVVDDKLGSAQIAYLAATFLIEESKPEEGLRDLSRIVANNTDLFRSERPANSTNGFRWSELLR